MKTRTDATNIQVAGLGSPHRRSNLTAEREYLDQQAIANQLVLVTVNILIILTATK